MSTLRKTLFIWAIAIAIAAACTQQEQVVVKRDALSATTAWPTSAWGVETPYWIPDQSSWLVPGWDDQLGHRVDSCYRPWLSVGDLKIFDGNFAGSCAKLHAVQATKASPFGFYFDTDYVTAAGWNGIDTVDWFSPAQIVSFDLAAGSHVLFCAGSLTSGIPGMPCTGAHLTMRAYDTTNAGGYVPFRTTSIAVGVSAPSPQLCDYLTAAGGIAPQKCVTCDRVDASGYPQMVCGDGFPRSGGYPIIGNPITGSNPNGGFGVPCLGHDFSGNNVVFVYPVMDATGNPTCS